MKKLLAKERSANRMSATRSLEARQDYQALRQFSHSALKAEANLQTAIELDARELSRRGLYAGGRIPSTGIVPQNSGRGKGKRIKRHFLVSTDTTKILLITPYPTLYASSRAYGGRSLLLLSTAEGLSRPGSIRTGTIFLPAFAS